VSKRQIEEHDVSKALRGVAHLTACNTAGMAESTRHKVVIPALSVCVHELSQNSARNGATSPVDAGCAHRRCIKLCERGAAVMGSAALGVDRQDEYRFVCSAA
jgi:hypothetical protein